MIKTIPSFFLVLAISTSALAENFPSVSRYAEHVYKSYSEATIKAIELQSALEAFVENPSELTHAFAKDKWIEARVVYSPTEIFRFYGGPIDDEDGPEGALNAWPLDEVYIDYVVGNANAGIINDAEAYPVITMDVLRDLNEKEGEKNISTGFHAIEFLLWGQDLNIFGPGNRKYTDYTTAKNAQRRGQYLKAVAEALVEDLESVRSEWDLSKNASYGSHFVLPQNAADSMQKILLSLYSMSAEELSQERIYVAYDTQQQEDEHSCFSDTTHMDVYYNFKGIKDVYSLIMPDLIKYDVVLAQKIQAQLNQLEAEAAQFPRPFDQAILSEEQRPHILQVVRSLEDLGELTRRAATAMGLTL